MTIDQFIEENRIAIFAAADLERKRYHIIKTQRELEFYDLFLQYVIHCDTDRLAAFLEGQLLPRMIQQGNARGVICKPNDRQIYLLFYNSEADALTQYHEALRLDAVLGEIMERGEQNGHSAP